MDTNTNQITEVTMKFGGSSLANAERVDYVANLIKGQIAAGYRPRAVICSAMGKTTNSLLSAGEFALGTCKNSGVRVMCKTFDWKRNQEYEMV
jgi:aspartokinase